VASAEDAPVARTYAATPRLHLETDAGKQTLRDGALAGLRVGRVVRSRHSAARNGHLVSKRRNG